MDCAQAYVASPRHFESKTAPDLGAGVRAARSQDTSSGKAKTVAGIHSRHKRDKAGNDGEHKKSTSSGEHRKEKSSKGKGAADASPADSISPRKKKVCLVCCV